MFGTSIKSRVNRVIKQRIKVAQKKHDERVKEVEAEHQAAVEALRVSKDTTIEASALALVESVIGKL